MKRIFLLVPFIVAGVLAQSPVGVAVESAPYEILCGPMLEANGVVTYSLRSPYVAGESRVQILSPDAPTDRILFLLPVTPWPGFEEKWERLGSGMAEVVNHGYHNRFGYHVVVPDFPKHMPWFVDHAEDNQRRHETYMTEVLVPFVDQALEIKEPVRDLAGFSKGGFGSLSLLLRHPDIFHAASAWDPGGVLQPYDTDRDTNLSNAAGCKAQFEVYRLESSIQRNAEHFSTHKRIALSGYSNDKFKKNLRALRGFLNAAEISYSYSESVQVPHRWYTGWMEQALVSLREIRDRT